MATNQPPLYSMFVEAQYTMSTGEILRKQWVLYPPAKQEYGASPAFKEEACYMTRLFDVGGKKAKWKFEIRRDQTASAEVLRQLEEHASVGWSVLRPVVVQMAKDDYYRVYGTDTIPSTPYKLLRAFERVTKTRGYRLTNT